MSRIRHSLLDDLVQSADQLAQNLRRKRMFRGHSTKLTVRDSRSGSAASELEPHVERDERDGDDAGEDAEDAAPDTA